MIATIFVCLVRSLSVPQFHPGGRIELQGGDLVVNRSRIELNISFPYYKRFYWITKERLLLSLDGRFFLIDTKHATIIVKGNGYLAFYRDSSIGWISADQKYLIWKRTAIRIPRGSLRFIGTSAKGELALIELDSTPYSYGIFSISNDCRLTCITRIKYPYADETFGLVEPINAKMIAFAPADGRGIFPVCRQLVEGPTSSVGKVRWRVTQDDWLPTAQGNDLWIRKLSKSNELTTTLVRRSD